MQRYHNNLNYERLTNAIKEAILAAELQTNPQSQQKVTLRVKRIDGVGSTLRVPQGQRWKIKNIAVNHTVANITQIKILDDGGNLAYANTIPNTEPNGIYSYEIPADFEINSDFTILNAVGIAGGMVSWIYVAELPDL